MMTTIEGRLLCPEVYRLAMWLDATPEKRRTMRVELPGYRFVRLRESGRFQSVILEILGEKLPWENRLKVMIDTVQSGKWKNQPLLRFFIGSTEVGTISSRFRDADPEIFDLVEAGTREFDAQVSDHRIDSNEHIEILLKTDDLLAAGLPRHAEAAPTLF